MIFTFVLVGIGIGGLFLLGSWAGRASSRSRHAELQKQLRYQPLSLLFAVLLVLVNRMLRPHHADVLALGKISRPTSSLGILGIADGSAWSAAVPYVIGLPFIVTTIVVYLQVFRGGVKPLWRYLPTAIALSVPFSLMNSLTEELIFRVLGIEGLSGSISASVVALLCAAWFGVPHWFGKPGGPVGMLMAGFLGWLMALSVQQTGGIGVAWATHFAQDVPIITFLLMLSYSRQAPEFVDRRDIGNV